MSKTPPKPAGADKVNPVNKAAPETAAYITGACPILLDGKHYPPGAEIVLTPAQADRLGMRVTTIAAAPLLTPLE